MQFQIQRRRFRHINKKVSNGIELSYKQHIGNSKSGSIRIFNEQQT